ncbi:class I SAM-dependent methyltransferase [Candidatus Thorarchaeota archaeon]|nr:MAG: class I SAM-dependent methyltransferase [Candidatus Thorarchaeota archaeon]
MASNDFDKISLAYDSSIDWEGRLRREIPFIVEAVGGVRGKRILDLACGTGRHGIALSGLGADVVGVDSSEEMVSRARQMAEEDDAAVEFMMADMADIKDTVSGLFDMVICLGNSLALLPSQDTVQRVIADVHHLLAPGGVFLFQILNFEEILSSGFRYVPAKAGRTVDGTEMVFFRFFTHDKENQVSTLVLSAFEKREQEWQVMMSSIEVLQLNSKIVNDMMPICGFSEIRTYGSYDGETFDSQENRNLVVVALND